MKYTLADIKKYFSQNTYREKLFFEWLEHQKTMTNKYKIIKKGKWDDWSMVIKEKRYWWDEKKEMMEYYLTVKDGRTTVGKWKAWSKEPLFKRFDELKIKMGVK